MKKNFAWFFAATAVGSVAVFIFLVGRAYAYPVGADGQPLVPQTSSSFDIGTSFTNLFSPFQNFLKSMKESNQTTINVGSGANLPPPNLRLDIGAYFVQLDDWIATEMGWRPSGTFVLVVGGLSGLLGEAKQGVDWALGAAHL